MKFIGNEYDNYARCKVDYSDEFMENDEFLQFFAITDEEGNVIGEDLNEFCKD